MSVLYILISIISIISSYIMPYAVASLTCWFLFKKFEVESWKGLIPIYRYVILFKKIKVSLLYFWGPIVAFVSFFGLNAYNTIYRWQINSLELESEQSILENVLPVLIIVSGIAAIVLFVIGQVKKAKQLSKAFNKNTGFAVGIGLLEGLFLLILAFSKDTFNSSKLE